MGTGRTIRVLHLEDDPRDAELIRRKLEAHDIACDILWVDCKQAFESALKHESFDLVLADYNLPDYDGRSALARVRSKRPELPVIIISSSVGEEEAVECLKAGANDYVLKQRLQRLGAAVTRALQEAEQRQKTRQADALLRESDERLRLAMDSAPIGMALVATSGRWTRVNRSLCRLTGYSEDELLARDFQSLTHPDDLEIGLEDMRQMLVGEVDTCQAEQRYFRKDGRIIWISINVAPIRSPAGDVLYLVSQVQDVSLRKQHEERIKRLSRIQALLSATNAMIVRVRDRERLLEEACEIAVRAGGFRMAWVGIADPETLEVTPVARAGHEEGFLDIVRRSAEAGSSGQGSVERALREKRPIVLDDYSDHAVPVLREAALARGYHSEISLPLTIEEKVVAVLSIYSGETFAFDEAEVRLLRELAGDVSLALDYLEKQKRIDYLAFYDSLTGLPNRSLFCENLNRTVRSARRNRGKLALVEFNVQRFRFINSTLGRHAGDELLKLMAERVQGLEEDEGCLARVAPATFALVLSVTGSEGDIASLVEKRVLEPLHRPFTVAGAELRIAVRCGVALFPHDGADGDDLFDNADAALAKAEELGHQFLFYEPQMNHRIAEWLALESKLRVAIEESQFVLHYQPKFDNRTRALTGLEALIRWADPAGGLVPPANFIPILEETGMILEAGRWALEKALSDRRKWLADGLAPPRIAVNVSGIQLQQKDFVETVREVIDGAGEDCGLDLEITESTVMRDVEDTAAKLKAIREMGLRVHVDDFGTGYSSLNYIARLPIDALKIDRSFINNMATDPGDMAIVSAIISLAHSLNLSVVAEGVETLQQQKLLERLDCDEVQGYLYSRPLPAEQIEQTLPGHRGMSGLQGMSGLEDISRRQDEQAGPARSSCLS